MLVWVAFMAGVVLRILAKVNQIVNDHSIATAVSFKQVFEARWVVFLIRAVICVSIFGIVFGGGAPEVCMLLGITPPLKLEELDDVMKIAVVGPSLAVLIGFCADNAISYIPSLKTWVPPLDVQTSSVKQVTTDSTTGSVQTVEQTTKVTKTPSPEV